MSKILLSINPEHVKNILNGSKSYEYRKTVCKKEVTEIVIYATAPIKKVVAEVGIDEILIDNPKNIWEITQYKSGITRDFYDDYYKGKDTAVAYKLGKLNAFTEPKKLTDYGIHSAPQSFVYID